MDVAAVLEALGGAARREQLLAAGVTRYSLRTAIARAEITRVHAGCYALPHAKPEVIVARMFRAQLTCLTACATWELPQLTRDTTAHLLIPRDRGLATKDLRTREGVHLHRCDSYRPDRLVSSPAAAIDLAGRCTSDLAHLVIVDAALRRGMLTARDLASFTVSTRSRREFLVTASSPTAESILETVVRYRLVSAGLRVEPQVSIRGVGRVDLLVDGSLIVELDGREWHDDPRAFVEDRRRDRAAAAQGFPVLRFTYQDVMGQPDRVVPQVLAALRAQRRTDR